MRHPEAGGPARPISYAPPYRRLLPRAPIWRLGSRPMSRCEGRLTVRGIGFALDVDTYILQSMRMSSTFARSTASAVADAIARIEERRDALDLLAAWGMEVCERLAAGLKVEIPGRKPFADDGRAFAVLSRAVRLCLALASRLDEVLIDLLRGGPIPDLAILAPEGTTGLEPASQVAPQAAAEPVFEPKARIARAVDDVIEAEMEAGEGANRMRSYVQERLVEREDYDGLLHRPWRVVVQAICADLGLKPDWGAWDNGRGFRVEAKPPTGDSPPNPLVPSSAKPRFTDTARGYKPTARGP